MILKEVYDYESFKEGQEEIIEKILKTKPVWGCTTGGKSCVFS